MIKKNLESWNEGLFEPLKKTLLYAQRHIPYYTSTINTLQGQTIHELLQCIPLLEKETVIDHLQQFRKDNLHQPGRVSTGTLRRKQRFMDVQYTNAEMQAIQCFYHHHRSWSHAYRFDKYKPIPIKKELENIIVFQILNTHYEVPFHIPNPNLISILWTSHANTLEIIKKTLKALEIIHIFEVEASTLIKLTIMLEQQQFNFNQMNVTSMMIFGFISKKWRDFIAKRWQCTISEAFSLSEMRAKAYLCQHGQTPHFHFKPLPIVTEIIHPITRESIDAGAGLLCLTPLYPFTQQQLLLRYLTQDIVNIVPCDETSLLGFSWCGRERDVVFLDNADASHSSVGLREIIECLDHYYEIARSDDDFEILGLIETGSVGWPLCKIEYIKHTLNIHLILIYPPALFVEKTNNLCQAIKNDILLSNEYLRQNVHCGHLEIKIIPHPPTTKNNGCLDGWHHQAFQSVVKLT